MKRMQLKRKRVQLRRRKESKLEIAKWSETLNAAKNNELKPGAHKQGVIGVDPGINGAIAFVTRSKKYCTVIDMPTMPKQVGKGRIVNMQGLFNTVQTLVGVGYRFDGVVVENVHAMPTDGGSSGFNFGRVFGEVECVFHCLGYPVVYVAPQTWKRQWELLKMPDETAREVKARALHIARQIFPFNGPDLARVKDSDRGEALLIGLYGERQCEFS